jgi:hypothetical protein
MQSTLFKLEIHFTMSFPSQTLRHLLHAVTIIHIADEAFTFVILIRTQALMQILTQIQPSFLMREFFRAVCLLLSKLKQLFNLNSFQHLQLVWSYHPAMMKSLDFRISTQRLTQQQ